jgi:hypothetical protein
MAEIALALAMAFFSIMVVTMISMGADFQGGASSAMVSPDGLTVVPSAPAPDSRPVNAGGELVVIHYHGRFYSKDLVPLDPAAMVEGRRVILAIEPSSSMAEALAARQRLPVQDLIVSTLDERWLETLKGRLQ